MPKSKAGRIVLYWLAAMGLLNGMLVEYDTSTLAPLGLIVGADELLGKKMWIGSLELGLFLEHALGVECRTASYQSGDDVAADGRRLAHHFQTQGTPVMIGGGQLAFTLLGVHWDPTSGDIRYLIMDPHYTGADDLAQIQPKWVGWKSADSPTHLGTKLFDKDVF